MSIYIKRRGLVVRTLAIWTSVNRSYSKTVVSILIPFFFQISMLYQYYRRHVRGRRSGYLVRTRVKRWSVDISLFIILYRIVSIKKVL